MESSSGFYQIWPKSGRPDTARGERVTEEILRKLVFHGKQTGCWGPLDIVHAFIFYEKSYIINFS